MNNMEALEYCLGFFDDKGMSQMVIDAYGGYHWVMIHGRSLKLESDLPEKPFRINCEPYRIFYREGGKLTDII